MSRRHIPIKLLWSAAGFLALLLGIIGIVLPVLPTTPFVILAAFCFGQSSPRLHAWLHNHRVFGPIIQDWADRGAIAPRFKAMAATMMAAAFGLSLWMDLPTHVLVIQAICLSGAAAYVLSRPNH